jgi:hypothetical protein
MRRSKPRFVFVSCSKGPSWPCGVRDDYRMMRRLTDEARQVSERLPNPVIRLNGWRLHHRLDTSWPCHSN